MKTSDRHAGQSIVRGRCIDVAACESSTGVTVSRGECHIRATASRGVVANMRVARGSPRGSNGTGCGARATIS
jgi:hypothetical protein